MVVRVNQGPREAGDHLDLVDHGATVAVRSRERARESLDPREAVGVEAAAVARAPNVRVGVGDVEVRV